MKNIVIIDTETNYYNELMSIGLVICNNELVELARYYYIISPECDAPSLYYYSLYLDKVRIDYKGTHEKIMNMVIKNLKEYDVDKIFAYNAGFDYNFLKELQDYEWYDIMRMAIYKEYNSKITDEYPTFKTGRLKRNYGVEPIYQMLSGDRYYHELHNALTDAVDETEIMRLLGLDVDLYIKLN